MAFRGHASKGSVQPVQVPDAAAKIIAQGAQTLKAMKTAQEFELQRSMDWLKSKREAEAQEEAAMKVNFDIDQKGNEIRHKGRQKNFQIRKDNVDTELKNHQNLVTGITGAAKAIVDYGKHRQSVNENAQDGESFLKLITGEEDVGQQLGAKIINNQAAITAESTDTSADLAKVQGVNNGIVQGMRSQSMRFYDEKSRTAALTLGVTGFKGELESQLATGDQLITVTDETTGQTQQIPINQVRGSKQTAAAAAQLLPGFLAKYGINKHNALLNAPQLVQLRQSIQTVVGNEQAAELKQLEQSRAQTLKTTYLNNPTSKAAQEFVWANSHNGVTPHESVKSLFDFFGMKGNDGDLRMTDGQVRDNLRTTGIDPAQPHQSLEARFPELTSNMWEERRKAVLTDFQTEQNYRNMHLTKATQGIVDGLGEAMQNGDSPSNEDIDQLVKDMMMAGHTQSQIARVESFKEVTNETIINENLEEQFEEQILVGGLTKQEILNSGLDNKKKAALLKQVGDLETAGSKAHTESIKDAIEDKTGYISGKSQGHWSTPMATERALKEYRSLKWQYIKGGVPEEKAGADAWKEVIKEIEKDDGRYSVKGMVLGGDKGFEHEVNQVKVPSPELMNKEWKTQLETHGPSAINTQPMISQTQLQSIADKSKDGQGGIPQVPFAANMIAAQIPGTSGLDVARAQMEHYNIPIPATWKGAISVDEDMGSNDVTKRLTKQYVTPLRATLATQVSYNASQGISPEQTLRSSGAVRRSLRGNPIVISGGQVGDPASGRSTGPHADVVVRDPQGNKIDPAPFLNRIHYNGKPVLDSFGETSGYGWRTVMGRSGFHAARDIGTPQGTPLEVVGGQLIKTDFDKGGWGRLKVFNIGGGYTIQIGHLAGGG